MTTCLRPTIDVEQRLQQLMKEKALSFHFVERKKISIHTLQQTYQLPVLVVDKQRLEYYPLAEETSFFFHPSSAVFRIKQFDTTGYDPLIAIARLEEGMAVLDCTLGLGSDAIVMSHAVGSSGQVVALESKAETALIVREGLLAWQEGYEPINEAMRRIKVLNEQHIHYLKALPTDSFDVIYFDPMFEKTVTESIHLNGLRTLADYEVLSEEAIGEAKRVARKRIVLKAHFESELFNQFAFERIKRKSSKLHYGVIELT
nr:class I SAM-dependent methyltransferase [Exiguobacterium sp. s193]